MGRTPFDDLLTRLSRRERIGFVSALLAARGWAVEVDPPVVRASKGDRYQVVAVARDGVVRGHGLPRESADAVVAVDAERADRLATAHGARAWDARVLYDMARHGLDPAATDRLFTEYLGSASEAVGRPRSSEDVGSSAGRDEGRVADNENRTRTDTAESEAAIGAVLTNQAGPWLIPVLLTVLLVVGAGLAVQTPIGLSATGATDDGSGADRGTAVSDSSWEGASPTALPTATATPVPEEILSGLTTSGVADTAVLAQGHAAALTNRSYTMSITYTESVDGETVGTAREVIRVESETVYRSTGTRSGTLVSDLLPVIVRDLYADGEGRYLRQGDSALRVGDADDPGTGQFAERSRALVAWYLSGTTSTFVDRTRYPNTVYYRVSVEGTSDRRIEEYQATGLISGQGLVVRVNARYRLPGTDRTATVSLRYVDVGNTAVDRPDWMSSRNESARRTTDFAR